MNRTKSSNFRFFPSKCLLVNKFFIAFPLLFLAFLLLGKSALYRFLATTERMDSNLLVVEGWTDPAGLLQAASEIEIFGYQHVIVASLAYPFDATHAFPVTGEGGLVFDVTGAEKPLFADSLTVVAASQDLQEIPAHFQLLINNAVVGEAYTRETLASYRFALADSIQIETITIAFDNDGFVEGVGDRNLLVQSVKVGNQTFFARMPNVRYDRGAIDGNRLHRTDHRSEADQAAEVLRSAGVPEQLLTTVAAPPTDYDRTYAAAVAVRDWLAQQPGGIPPALNVLSESAHARRSRLLYQKAFGGAVQVGVIAAPRDGVRADSWWKQSSSRNFTLAQIAKYVYARLFFWPDSPAPSR